MALYKNVLHHRANTTPKWLLETIGVYVSLINQCNYCVAHHFEGLRKLLNDDDKANAIKSALTEALESGVIETPALSPKEIAALIYTAQLTNTPAAIARALIDQLRTAGWDDGEILEFNQVAAYFAYANRTVLGLGVTTEGDQLGLSPNNRMDSDDWGHR